MLYMFESIIQNQTVNKAKITIKIICIHLNLNFDFATCRIKIFVNIKSVIAKNTMMNTISHVRPSPCPMARPQSSIKLKSKLFILLLWLENKTCYYNIINIFFIQSIIYVNFYKIKFQVALFWLSIKKKLENFAIFTVSLKTTKTD